MARVFTKLTGRINRRFPQNEGKIDEVLYRENLLSRDGRLRKVRGTEKFNASSALSDIARWGKRYYSVEVGSDVPKTFYYTQDGKIYLADDVAGTMTEVKDQLNKNARPNAVLIKTSEQTVLYFCEGDALYKYDGNNDNVFEQVTVEDADGNSINFIDLEEHADRLWGIDETYLYCSKNLDFDVFNDSTDSLAIIVGSGKGRNLGLIRLNDYLYIFTTEGIFYVVGDLISAVAETFSVEPIEDKKAISGQSIVKVENSIIFLSTDYELYSFAGSRGSTKLLTYYEKLKDFMNLNMAWDTPAIYEDHYYKMSFVEKGKYTHNMEIWYDAYEDKCEFIRGRNVSCYVKTDPTEEKEYSLIGRSDVNYIMYTDRNHNFDGTAIRIRVTSQDITPQKGYNMRFIAFYPEISEPIGNHNLMFRYLLNGRLSNPDNSGADWSQNIDGENKGLGFIEIKNQSHFTDRIRPKIKYSKGESIRIEIDDATADLDFGMVGIGIEFIGKGKVKGKAVGQ